MGIWDVIGGIIRAFGVAVGVLSILLGSLIVVIVLWSVRRFIRRLRESLAVQGSWTRTTALVAEVRHRSLVPGDPPRPVGVYTYRDAAGRERTGADEGRALVRPAVGQSIRIAFDPDDPAVSHPLTGIRGRIGVWAVLFAIVILLLATCAGMLFVIGIGVFVNG